MMQTSIETPGVLIGTIAGVDGDGRPRVRWSDGEPIAANVVWMPASPNWSQCIGVRVVIGFIDADEAQPIVLGLLDAPPTSQPREPDVLRIASGRELIIECGQAKIMLR